ncbi:hypothetical protein CRN35_12685, partial [Vibrio vulnificus]
ALAIRIIFPSVRAIRASFNPTGLPASLGKQKNQSRNALVFICLILTLNSGVDYAPSLCNSRLARSC